MKLEIKRVASENKALLGGLKFNYSINVKLIASDDEKKLWDKYGYSSETLTVIGGSIDSNLAESFNGHVKGAPIATDFNLLTKGVTWESKELFVVFTNIPNVIAEKLVSMEGQLKLRENWNGNDETTDLT